MPLHPGLKGSLGCGPGWRVPGPPAGGSGGEGLVFFPGRFFLAGRIQATIERGREVFCRAPGPPGLRTGGPHTPALALPTPLSGRRRGRAAYTDPQPGRQHSDPATLFISWPGV